MAGTKISDYAVDTDKWTELLETLEKQREGYIGLSLTNYDNSNLPAVAAASYLECAGALYGFASEEAIGGSATTGNVNYIIFDPTPMTLVWSIVVPTWSDAKNGWYDAGEAKRYIGGCYFATPNYTKKWVYIGRDIRLYNMSANSIDSDQYVNGSIDAIHIAANAVETAKIKDANVTAAKVLKTFTDDGQAISGGSSWVPAAGLYNMTGITGLRLDIKIDAVWRPSTSVAGLFLCDGTNMRVFNTTGGPLTVYYHKFD